MASLKRKDWIATAAARPSDEVVDGARLYVGGLFAVADELVG